LPEPVLSNNPFNTIESIRELRESLISDYINGKREDFLRQHAQLLDHYFLEQFAASEVGPEIGIIQNPFAIVALGGYGREEQCIHSDVDLLILFQKKVPKTADGLIKEVVYPLWDLGLEVGYAIRSLKESIRLAGKDFEVLTSLLDARFVCGMSQVYTELVSAIRESLIQKKSDDLIHWLFNRNEDRHLHFGDSSYLLEPNLKDGHGGLRDYHTMLWIARILSNLKEPRDLEYEGYVTQEEFQTLEGAIAFIWRVRNLLHHLTRRKCDQLYFEHQIQVADLLKFKPVNGMQPVEQFLGILHGHMEFIKQQHQMFLHDLGLIRKFRPERRTFKSSKIKDLLVDKGTLNFTSPKKILKSPELLMEIFHESARLKAPLGVEAKRLVREFSYLIDDDFKNSPRVVKAFEKVLQIQVPEFNVLDDMLSTGFLENFIPEMASISNRIQYDDYHVYPVDRHSLKTVHTVKSFNASPDILLADLYMELKKKKLLLWAALLHDIGKGDPSGGHAGRGAEMVRKILETKGLPSKDIDTIAFLVRLHLFLVEIATRRDIQDEETALFCANEIKDVERLKMLYLLSVADSMSTGPKAWNDWTSTLFRDLFLKVMTTLEKGELATQDALNTIERKRAEIHEWASAEKEAKELDNLFNMMSPRYLLYTSPMEIKDHVRLYQGLENVDFVWEIATEHESNTRRVTVCAKDRPGLFSKIAGVFTLNGLDILDVQVFTWRNNIALDIFKVEPPPDHIFESEKWDRAEKNLAHALSGELDLGKALDKRTSVYRSKRPATLGRPHHVIVDNETSSFFTIIDVFTYDFPGLLFLITDALFRCKLDVWVAKIGTKIDQVVDVFYVRDFDGQKVDSPEQVSEIKKTILDVLEGS